MYVACLRNYTAQANYLLAHHARVAVIGAGSRGEFRNEDQLCCAWIAGALLDAGYEAEDGRTIALVKQWSRVSADAITGGASADYLRNSGQSRDLGFILAHVDDLDEVYRFERGQVMKHAEELLLR